MLSTNSKSLHPFLIVMRALFMGRQVKLGKNLYACADDNTVGWVDTLSYEGIMTFADGPSINYLIKACEALSEEEIISIAAGFALQSINEDKGR